MTLSVFAELMRADKTQGRDIRTLSSRGGIGLLDDYFCPETLEHANTTQRSPSDAANRVQYQPFTLASVAAFDRFAVYVAAGQAAGRYLSCGFYTFAGDKLWDHYVECDQLGALVSTADAGGVFTLYPGHYLFAYSVTNIGVRLWSWERAAFSRRINNVVYSELLSFYGSNAQAGAPPVMPDTAGTRTTNDTIDNSVMPVAIFFDGT